MSGSRSPPVPGPARRSTGSSRARPGAEDLPRYNDRRRGRHQRLAGARRRGHHRRRPVPHPGPRRSCSAIFAVAVTVVGGWRGVRSLIALALTLVGDHQDRRPAHPRRPRPGLGRDPGRDRRDHRDIPADRGLPDADPRGRGRHIRVARARRRPRAHVRPARAVHRSSAARRTRPTSRRSACRTSTSAGCSWPGSSSARSASSTT